MLSYTGTIQLTPHLNQDEVEFLNNWQNKLYSIYHRHIHEYSGSRNFKNLSSDLTCEIEHFLGLSLDKNQHWTILFCFSPMIHFTEQGMDIYGSDEKGQFREALLAYQHFFMGEQAVLRDACYEHLSFIQSHVMNGIISCENTKLHDNSSGKWCYLVKDNQIVSVDAPNAQAWLKNPNKYPEMYKEDTTKEKLDKYFPPLIQYARINRSTLDNLSENIDIAPQDEHNLTFKI
jgi:hypothetical protein